MTIITAEYCPGTGCGETFYPERPGTGELCGRCRYEGRTAGQDADSEPVTAAEDLADRIEQEQDWLFSFGSGQQHDGHFVVIRGTAAGARAKMIRRYGQRWSFQYDASMRGELESCGMTELADLRQAAWSIVAQGVAAGLPVPARINIHQHADMVEIFAGDDVAEAVDRWAEHLGLPTPAMTGDPCSTGARVFDPYESVMRGAPGLPGWKVRVCSYITLPAEGGEAR